MYPLQYVSGKRDEYYVFVVTLCNRFSEINTIVILRKMIPLYGNKLVIATEFVTLLTEPTAVN